VIAPSLALVLAPDTLGVAPDSSIGLPLPSFEMPRMRIARPGCRNSLAETRPRP
jgi:hypothetical protein